MTRSTTNSPQRTRATRQRTPAQGKKNQQRLPNITFPVLAVIVVFGSLLGIVVFQTFIVQNRVQLDMVSSELTEARALNQELRLEVIELESPERILEAASNRLGMVRPAARVYLPGIDPDLEAIIQPPATGDPFGPAPLSDELMNRFTLTLQAAGIDEPDVDSATPSDDS